MNIVIPVSVRKALYIVFGALGAVQTAAYAAYAAIHIDPPVQLIAGSAAFASLSAAPFLVALLHITPNAPAPKNTVIPSRTESAPAHAVPTPVAPPTAAPVDPTTVKES